MENKKLRLVKLLKISLDKFLKIKTFSSTSTYGRRKVFQDFLTDLKSFFFTKGKYLSRKKLSGFYISSVQGK